jgi:hypothetical protein
MHTLLTSSQWRAGRRKPRGNALVESALVISLVFIPLALGIAVVGLNIVRIIQVNQVNRDTGHMFARGVDFSGSTYGLLNQAIVFQMAPRLQDTSASGTAVLILSAVEYLNSTTTCPTGCTNLGYVVFTKQITLGKAALRASSFGTVPAASLNADGSVKNPTTDASARATGVLTYLAMSDGDVAYVSETFFSSTDLARSGIISPSGTYARAFF